jgi:hypothetical protein
MNFYPIKTFQDNQSQPSCGVDIRRMADALQILDKKSNFKTLDSMIDLSVVFFEENYSVKKEETLFSYESKKLSFSIVDKNKIFEVSEKNGATYFCAIHEGCLKSFLNKSELENKISNKSISSVDPIVNKAIDWLDNGQVGLSSATMCATFFPQLKQHHKLKDLYDYDDILEVHYPYDNGDFGRCLKLIESVPEIKSRLGELKSLSKEWSNLVDNWTEIESLIHSDKDASYSLIKKCLGQKPKSKL